MRQIKRDVRADFGCELAGFHGEPGHVHLLVNFPPTAVIFHHANNLKDAPSRALREESQTCGRATGARSAHS